MVVGLPLLRTKWQHKYRRAERCCDRSNLLNRFHIIKQGVANPVHIGGRPPGVNAFCPADLVRRRSVTTIRANENRGVNFAAKIFQKSRQRSEEHTSELQSH